MKESYFLSKNKICEIAVGYLRNGDVLELSYPLPLCSVLHENLLVGISGDLGMKESTLSKQKCVLRKCYVRVSKKLVNARTFNILLLCPASMKTYF